MVYFCEFIPPLTHRFGRHSQNRHASACRFFISTETKYVIPRKTPTVIISGGGSRGGFGGGSIGGGFGGGSTFGGGAGGKF